MTSTGIRQFEIQRDCPDMTSYGPAESNLPMPLAVWVNMDDPRAGLRCGAPGYPILQDADHLAYTEDGSFHTQIHGSGGLPVVCLHMGRFIE